MQETDSSGETGAGDSGPAPLPSEPPSSSREFIGTNANAAQAYVPPMVLPETPEAPEAKVPATKVALAEEVDPRKAPTNPALAKAARAMLAAELGFNRPAPHVVEAPPDSQSSGIRRGAGYAPKGAKIPAPVPSSPRMDALSKTGSREARSGLSRTPPKALSTRDVLGPRSRGAVEGAETPQQKRAAMVLVLLFAMLLAVAVYFLLGRGPAPAEGSGSPQAPGAPGGSAR